MRWLFGTMFIIALYLFATSLYIFSNILLIAAALLLILISSVANIILSVRAIIQSENPEKSENQMRKIMLFVKLMSVPFFIFNFLRALLTFMPFGAVMAFGDLIFVPLAVFATYLLMIATSAFSIPVIAFYRKSKKIKTTEAAIHIILQLIFVIDVIDSIYLFIALSKKDADTLPSRKSCLPAK